MSFVTWHNHCEMKLSQNFCKMTVLWELCENSVFLKNITVRQFSCWGHSFEEEELNNVKRSSSFRKRLAKVALLLEQSQGDYLKANEATTLLK